MKTLRTLAAAVAAFAALTVHLSASASASEAGGVAVIPAPAQAKPHCPGGCGSRTMIPGASESTGPYLVAPNCPSASCSRHGPTRLAARVAEVAA